MTASACRIISLIPSATEIVDCLGWRDRLVGRSHECDYPPGVEGLPICTAPKFNPEGSSLEVHQRVTDLLQSALSVYTVDLARLKSLNPTHVLTQAQCEVCAVSLDEVARAVATLVPQTPKVLSLQPAVLNDLWHDIRTVAQAIDGDAGLAVAETAIAALQSRVEHCVSVTQELAHRPTVACIEWIAPLMAAGNWVPELVQLAGGQNCFGTVGKHSPWMTWEELTAANPDVIVAMPCGYDMEKTRTEMAVLIQHPDWDDLKAVKTRRVYLVDGNQYFNRPGPRLVDSLEILAEIFHPQAITFGYESQGWQQFQIG
ncbi:MAG: cobalamin-binding protein [Cyanobacteria bacterium P01_A01_bin.123]